MVNHLIDAERNPERLLVHIGVSTEQPRVGLDRIHYKMNRKIKY